MNLKNIIDKKNYIRTIGIIVAVIILLIIPSLGRVINKTTIYSYSHLRGELKPDTNIVIIDISENDINNLGHWPIKRSYYALLINSLEKYKVKRIGLEVFLSAKFVTQTLYDNLLTEEIKKAGNVVLGSVAGDIYLKGGRYYTDSLSYPSPKLLSPAFKTGHLNYLSSNGVQIPLIVHNNGFSEDAFALALSGNNSKGDEGKILDVNFISRWKRFEHINLIKFFSMMNSRNPQLNNLKGKTVIIGISDPLIASTIKTVFDGGMPGVALHAFALDNILKNRGINDRFMSISEFVFIVFVFLLALFSKKNLFGKFYISLLLGFVLFVVLTFSLFTGFNIIADYSSFLLPFVFLVITDLLLLYSERNLQLEGVIDESKILKSLLENKEGELVRLQKELNTDPDGSDSLLEKIKSLKNDIRRLKENEEDKKEIEEADISESQEFQKILYRSKSMSSVIDLINKAAPGNANVLILGESGTGKELVAKAIHALSERSGRNFVAVNCGAISDTLLESELFGHVKGAFTGAVSDKIGRFEAADSGTIFLDEIAETSENFQVKLLRIIQTGDFEKVGSSRSQHVNVRIIAATNKKLEKEVKEKRFREDLYYRINVIKIELPPLRDRKEDIEILAKHFLRIEDPELTLSKAAAEALEKYEWKGNVRELEAVIKRAVIFAKSAQRSMVQLADLKEEIVKGSKYNFEDLVIESLRDKEFSRSSIIDTAKELGNVSRTLISENFRGYSLKSYVDNNYDLNKAAYIIAGTEEDGVKEKVKAKLSTFLNNIRNDLNKLETDNFEEVRQKLNSKYKNLPQKFHYCLDDIIKRELK